MEWLECAEAGFVEDNMLEELEAARTRRQHLSVRSPKMELIKRRSDGSQTIMKGEAGVIRYRDHHHPIVNAGWPH